MTIRANLSSVFAALVFAAIALPLPAQALTTLECVAKYHAAKGTGTLNGQKWSDFRKASCGADPAAAPAATSGAAPVAAKETAPAAAPAGVAVFPTAVDPKYARENPNKARTNTCADQFNANKVRNSNGGMVWIDRSGGYLKACTQALK